MKKVLLSSACIFITILACAQAKIQTKQYVLNDFPEKTLKVLLTGNEIFDSALRANIQEIWHISPFEFCEREEFASLKRNDEYYFLVLTDTKSNADRKQGIRYLSVLKGKDTATDGVNGMYRVINIPFCAAGSKSGREAIVMGPMIAALQTGIEKMMKRPINLVDGVMAEPFVGKGKWNRKILVEKSDLSYNVGGSLEAIYKVENIYLVDDIAMAEAVDERSGDKIICYAIIPAHITKGSVSYTMLFKADTYELIYMKSHTISSKTPAGILQDEMREFISRNK